MISLHNYLGAQDALTSHHATTLGADMAALFDTVSPDSILSEIAMASAKAGTGVWTSAGKNIETQCSSAAATTGWGCPPIDPEGVTASDLAVTQTWTRLDNSLN